MPTKRVQFTDWLPDQPDNSGALNEAKNVTPVSVGYQPFPNAEDFSEAAAENINSVFVAKFDTEVVLFAGGATKIFKFNSSTEALEDKSKVRWLYKCISLEIFAIWKNCVGCKWYS